jgi:hypothetical protein
MKLHLVVSAALLVLLGILIGAFTAIPVSAQNAPSPSAAVGRYQMQLSVHTGNSTSTSVFVIDTVTGQCWYRETAGGRPWTDHGSPALAPGK